jgi:hypothetical protein
MKNFPKKFTLTILGQKVPVKTTKELPDHLAGFYNTKDKEIQISEGQTKPDAVMTLIHEAFHALSHRAGLSQVISPEMDEIIAEQVSIMIHENFNLSLKKRK